MKLLPDLYFERIWHIPVETLVSHGIKGVILDIDGTLAPDGAPQAAPEAARWLGLLCDAGIGAAIVSNNGDGRVAPFAESLGLGYVSHALKPSLKTLPQALEAAGADAAHTAVIGDQLYTDMLYAGRAGCLGVMVEHAWPDIYPFVKFKRVLEAPFMPSVKRRRG